jgi:hypothetical protein
MGEPEEAFAFGTDPHLPLAIHRPEKRAVLVLGSQRKKGPAVFSAIGEQRAGLQTLELVMIRTPVYIRLDHQFAHNRPP